MKFNTALGFALLALCLSASRSKRRMSGGFSSLLCCLVIALSLATLSEYLLSIDLKIDEFFFYDFDGMAKLFPPGRLAPITAMNFIFLSLALLLSRRPRALSHLIAQFLTIIVFFVSLQGLLGYALDLTYLFGSAFYTQMALHTAIAFLVLSSGILSLYPEEGFVQSFLGKTALANMTRLLLLAAMIVPLFVLWFGRSGLNLGLYDKDFFQLIQFVGTTMIMSFIIMMSGSAMFRVESDKRHQDLELTKSELKFRDLANSMPQIVWTADAEGNLDYFNKVWFDYSGTDYESNVGAGWVQAVHPEDLPHTIENWTKALERGEVYENEFRLRASNGDYRWHVARAIPIRDEHDVILHWYGTNTDIHSAKSLANQLLKASIDIETEKLKFQTLFADASSSMALLKGRNFVYEMANKKYLDLFQNRELIGRPFLIALPELEGQEFPLLAQHVFDTGETYVNHEAKAFLRRTEGGVLEERYFDQKYSRVLDAQGQPYGVFIHALEVTDAVMARAKLEETSERFRLAIEAANMGTWELNPETYEIVWSERTRELFGIERPSQVFLEEVVNRIHVDDRARVNMAITDALDPTGRGDYIIEYRVVHPSGSIRWLSFLGKTFFDENAKGKVPARFAGTVLDVTDKILAEEALRDAKERAEAASAAKTAFLANMSHEIRTPLGAIMGFVSLLKDEELGRQDASEYITVVERNATQLLRIIDDILDLSKVEAGKIVIETIDFSLLEILADFSSLMGFKARANGIDFKVVAETKIPDPVSSDPTRIRQILNNAVGNAIKFTKKGRVELSVRYEEDFLVFKVTDTGRGISPAQAKDLFQPFAQADVSTTRKYGGTGLGLVLTRRLCEALGGNFWLEESELGKGSVFVARIQVNIPKSSKMIAGTEFRYTTELSLQKAAIRPVINGMQILVVEDSPDNQLLLRKLLTRFGANVTIAVDGVEGIEKAMERDFDVVLMDVQMPRMDGYEAVAELRKKGYSKPVIALTAHAMQEEREACLAAGYSEFLSKPINPHALLDLLEKLKAQV